MSLILKVLTKMPCLQVTDGHWWAWCFLAGEAKRDWATGLKAFTRSDLTISQKNYYCSYGDQEVLKAMVMYDTDNSNFNNIPQGTLRGGKRALS